MRVGTRLRPSRTLLAPFAALLACGIAAAAQGEALTYDAVHKIRFSLNGEIAEVSATGSGVAIVNGGVVGGPLQTLELTAPFAEIDATALGSSQMGLESVRFKDVRLFRTMAPFAGPGGSPGVFAPIATAAMDTMSELTRNTLPVGGSVTLCKSFGCGDPIVVPLSQSNAMEAVGVGVGGTFMESYSTFPPVFLTVEGQPWTIHKAMVSYDTFTPSGTGTGMLTETGFAHGPAMSPASTAVPGGVVQLVSGVQVTALGLNNNSQAGQVGILTITFTPEPTRFLLLGAGAAATLLLGRRRIRRSRRDR
jgi:hypothetical protein